MNGPQMPRVQARLWKGDTESGPVIQIRSGPQFVLIKYKHARAVVDEVHDLCDAYERNQREDNAE